MQPVQEMHLTVQQMQQMSLTVQYMPATVQQMPLDLRNAYSTDTVSIFVIVLSCVFFLIVT